MSTGFMFHKSSDELSLRPNPIKDTVPVNTVTIPVNTGGFMFHKSSYEPSKVIFVYSCIPADIDCCLSCYAKMSDNARKQLNLLAVYNREERGHSGLLHRFLWCDLCNGIINMSTEDQGETKLQVALRLRGTLSLKQVIKGHTAFFVYTSFLTSSLS
jgi:hypothetical protein